MTPTHVLNPTLKLLGGIAVTGISAESANPLLAQAKVVGLLAYLALAPAGLYQRRDRIAGLLWPELDQGRARAALRKAVLAVRNTFGEDALVGRGDEELLLDSKRLECDARRFTELADGGFVAEALDLYRGDLMPGFYLNGCAEYGIWLDEERAQARQRAAAASWTLALRLEEDQKLTAAIRTAKSVARFDLADERVLRRTMQMLVRLGDRVGAIRLFEDARKRVRTDLDTELSKETRDLAEAIRRGD